MSSRSMTHKLVPVATHEAGTEVSSPPFHTLPTPHCGGSGGSASVGPGPGREVQSQHKGKGPPPTQADRQPATSLLLREEENLYGPSAPAADEVCGYA